MKVNNKKAIRRLTWRTVKSGRFRNFVAIIAIALTAIMFTTIATMGGAMIQGFEEATFRQVGTSSHGGIKYLSEADYEKIAAAGAYEDISYNIILGIATNPELSEKQHELRYTEEKSAEWGFSAPTVGTLPREYKDIAVSTITLDMMGLPHELGQTIHLDYYIQREGQTSENLSDDFRLVGYWPGDDVMQAAQCYLSREYVRDLAPDQGERSGPENLTGTIMADVFFKKTSDIEGQLISLLESAGIDAGESYLGINWAYLGSGGNLDFATVLLFALLILIIMSAGYLIIYSVFTISVSGDIQFYGLLKTIGTTGRQIKRIVRGQAMLLSAIGIPLGLLLGFFLGTRLSPVLMRMFDFGVPTVIKANPLFFLLAALFSLITVFISCGKPGRMAARVSPIEALRYTEGMGKTRKTEKKARKVTPFSMAGANVFRSKKKLVVVLLSLSMSMILLNSVVSMVNGFDMDEYLSSQVVADFYFIDSTVLNAASRDKNFEGVTDALLDEIEAMPGLRSHGRVFFRDIVHSFNGSDEHFSRFQEIIGSYEDNLGSVNFENCIRDESAYLKVYGLDELAFSKLQNFQNVSWEEFSSGNYALMGPYNLKNDPDKAFYRIGETIPLQAENGEIIEHEILGYVHYPYEMGCQYSMGVDSDLILSSQSFETLYGKAQPMSLLADVEDEYTDQAERFAENAASSPGSTLTVRSRSFYEAEFESMQQSYIIIGGVMAAILALIGILNFVNTMATSIMTRKRELAMLQSVGMTSVQLKQQLFFEGLWYALLTLLITLTLGSVISTGITNGIAGTIWFFRSSFSVTPMLICAPVLLLLCAVIPLLCARILRKESVVERLREN